MPDTIVHAAELAVQRAEADLAALGARTDANWSTWGPTETRLVAAKRALHRLRIAADR